MTFNTPQVLIIDDDPGVLFLHEIIVKEGALNRDPSTFLNAEKALDYIIPIDASTTKILIFLDINMPRINGWEFLEILVEKIKHADIKVVMVTSSLSKSEFEKSKEYEFIIDFWQKPMEEEQVYLLKENLGSWLGEHLANEN
ncbi:response regulator [Algoriphagus yeomjeoni]|uniref:response regulator n=1 Tax=Algoriphagus yeomjeoni TaxID=291403 RepID=UPI003CE4E4AF